jgi:uncharacterized protein (TIGR03435 family)
MILAILAKATVVMAAGLMGAWFARGSRAAVRHAVLAAVFAVLLVLPIASMVVPPVRVVVPVSGAFVETIGATPQVAASTSVGVVGASSVSRRALPSAASSLLAGWLCGSLFLLVRVMVGLRQVHTLRRFGLPWPDGQRMVDRLTRRRVELLVHESLSAPVTCGVLHPAIMLPLDAQRWDMQGLNRALVHEFEHVRRADWVSHCIARIVCAVYWFHPLVWVAWRRLALEAERACDDAVLTGSEATLYADQLVGLARRLSTDRKSPALAMANRSDLSARVGAVLDSGQRRGRAGKMLVATACAAAMLLVVTLSPLRIAAAPQTAAGNARAFEVASVKPYAPAGPPYEGCNSHDDSGMLKRAGCTLQQLVQQAYSVKAYQVRVKAPAWVSSDRFAVEARPNAPATRAEMTLMLQPLLTERFHLKIHWENTQSAVYFLQVASHGPKLGTATDTTRCGEVLIRDGVIRSDCVTTDDIAWALEQTFKQPVVNRTVLGSDRKFKVNLEFASGDDSAAGPSLFSAVQEQLGLVLKAGKAPMRTLVIDSAQRPEAN